MTRWCQNINIYLNFFKPDNVFICCPPQHNLGWTGEVTEAVRPGMKPFPHSLEKCNIKEKESTTDKDNDWNFVNHRGNKRKKYVIIPFVVPMQNRYETLSKRDDATNSVQRCPECGIEFSTKAIIEIHQRSEHGKTEHNCGVTYQEAHRHLEIEKKMHRETKKALEALQAEFKGCKDELMIVQEEKERLKIKFNDLNEIKNIQNSNAINKTHIVNIDKTCTPDIVTINCQECDFPMKTSMEKNNHMSRHKASNMKENSDQQCYLCKKEFHINTDFRTHILMNHQ